MNEIKVYKKLTYIETFDWLLRATETPIEKINSLVQDSKFLNLWDELLNVSNIKRIFTKQLSDVEQIIYSIEDKNIRKKVQAEVDKRTKDWLRINAEVLANILARYQK